MPNKKTAAKPDLAYNDAYDYIVNPNADTTVSSADYIKLLLIIIEYRGLQKFN